MFFRSVLHRTLALRRKGIMSLKVSAHAREGLRLHRISVLLVTVGSVPRQPVIGSQLHAAPGSHKIIKRFCSIEREYVLPVVRVIDGHMPMNRVTVSHSGAAENRQIR